MPQRVYVPAGPVTEFSPRPVIRFSQNGSPGISITNARNHNLMGMPDADDVIETTTTSVRVAIRILVRIKLVFAAKFTCSGMTF